MNIRRKDKEITGKQVIEKIIMAPAMIRLGFFNNGAPEAVPVPLTGLKGGGFAVGGPGFSGPVYFQSNVCAGIKEGGRICSYSTKYMSVYGLGRLEKDTLFPEILSAKASAMTEEEIAPRACPPSFKKGTVDFAEPETIRLVLAEGGDIYIAPVNHAEFNGALYFHSAEEGRKMDILRAGNEIIIEGETPDRENPGTIIYKNTAAKTYIVTDPDEKTSAMTAIAGKFSGGYYEFMPEALEKIEIIRLEI